MSTINRFQRSEINKQNPIFSPIRTTIETVFYGNNVVPVNDLHQAYELAKASPGTVITDIPVYEPTKLGLPEDARVLLYNDGEITGRYAKARVLLGDTGVSESTYSAIAREAAFYARNKKLYHAEAYIGLNPDFMVKAHLLIQEGYENNLYSWLLNFQYLSEEYRAMYEKSKRIPEGDIYILSLPDYYPKTHEDGLCLFDSTHNSLLLCGMKYFGEHKKGTLTLAWGIANRNGYASCHGGIKRYNLSDRSYTVGVFGLSGSGKSTLTHDRHHERFDISILHDDAYIISERDSSSIALEPSYFDKTQDYPMDHYSNQYLLTVQNCGATLDEEGKVVLVNEDIRNGNGRAVKSMLWTQNRINKIEEPVNSIIWLMKDATIPPILKIKDPILAATFGATLATKRSTAERLAEGIDINVLVIEPYANPFRTYPLADDYEKFKYLFEHQKIECYIFNTGSFIDKDIPKNVTLALLEGLVENSLTWHPLGNFESIEYSAVEGFEPNFKNKTYREMWVNSLQYRLDFIRNAAGTRDQLPDETRQALEQLKKTL